MKKIIIVAGVTASGKSKLGIQLAQQLNGEIISADSVAVYRKMNIGSAKPSIEEQEGIVHHLINIRDIDDGYDVASFQKDARNCIDEIHQRHKVPIVVGGTGLYINALLYDYRFDYEETSGDIEFPDVSTMIREIEIINPQALDKVHPNNIKRVQRLYKKIVVEQQEIQEHDHKLLYDAHILFLEGDRERLYDRMNKRVENMFTQGLEAEVRGIVDMYDNAFDLPSMSAIGYREFRGYFEGTQSKEETIALIQRNTRRFAKRQITWFKHQLPSYTVDIESMDRDEIIQSCSNFLGNK